jgi:hypothetical protein
MVLGTRAAAEMQDKTTAASTRSSSLETPSRRQASDFIVDSGMAVK